MYASLVKISFSNIPTHCFPPRSRISSRWRLCLQDLNFYILMESGKQIHFNLYFLVNGIWNPIFNHLGACVSSIWIFIVAIKKMKKGKTVADWSQLQILFGRIHPLPQLPKTGLKTLGDAQIWVLHEFD